MMRVKTTTCALFVVLAAVVLSTPAHLSGAALPSRAPAIGATADDWPLFRGNPELHGVASGKLADDLELAWTLDTEGAVISSPVVSGGVVYVGSSDGRLYAVEAATGKKKWAYKTEDIIDAPPMVYDGVVYVGSSDFFFYAIDAKTGVLKWKFETQDKILGSASIAKGADGKMRILVGSYDTNLYCFDLAGTKLWQYTTENYVNGTPAVHAGRAVFGGCDAILHAVDINTGKAAVRIELGDECHVAGSVALAGNRVYFGHYGNAFICADVEKQELVWSYPNPRHGFFSSPAIGKDRVVFGGRDRKLHCVGREDGKPLWSFPTRRKVDASPVICDGKVVFGSGDGRVYMLRLSDGKQLWQYEVGRAVYSSPAVCAGMVFIGSNDKRLYAFRAKTK